MGSIVEILDFSDCEVLGLSTIPYTLFRSESETECSRGGDTRTCVRRLRETRSSGKRQVRHSLFIETYFVPDNILIS